MKTRHYKYLCEQYFEQIDNIKKIDQIEKILEYFEHEYKMDKIFVCKGSREIKEEFFNMVSIMLADLSQKLRGCLAPSEILYQGVNEQIERIQSLVQTHFTVMIQKEIQEEMKREQAERDLNDYDGGGDGIIDGVESVEIEVKKDPRAMHRLSVDMTFLSLNGGSKWSRSPLTKISISSESEESESGSSPEESYSPFSPPLSPKG